MLLDAIASVILAGMMLIPLINLIVGTIVGAGVAGATGSVLGILLALAITAGEVWLSKQVKWPHGAVEREPAVAGAAMGVELAWDGQAIELPTIRTGPPTGRRKLGRLNRQEAPSRPSRMRSAPLGQVQ